MNFINFLIVKILVKVKYANIINIAANDEVIPELIQTNCNSKNIFNKVATYLDDNQLRQNQIDKCQIIINDFKTNKSSEIAASVLTSAL